jgi:CheY-like chemotaxis protein
MWKILLIDDDDIANELDILIMESVGLTDVDVCSTGEDAIEYMENCIKTNIFPTFLIVDLNMPGISGLKFVSLYEEKYKKYSPYSCIIMLSNNFQESDKREALKYESVLDFWEKPLTAKMLMKLMKNVKLKGFK